ncbi:IclR family transcriptional regulator [Parageobacillus toebii]|uniref:IclR family transcriptional regulator n=1 Tax=Parageobacillus toebii TaxID=153151 RepID=UPI002E1E2053|nr:IclR family transcriptional regulator [Parageobacillus toebii]
MRNVNVETIRSVERAVHILNCFSFERPSLSIEEIVAKTKLAKATVYRLLWTLETQGLIHYDQKENLYRLGYKMLEYGGIVLENLDMRREAEPFLHELQVQTGYTVLFAVRQQDSLQYLIRLDSDDSFQPRSYIGRRRVLHYGALGTTIMAYLPEEEVKAIIKKHPLEAHTPNTIVDEREFMERLHTIRNDGFFVDKDETFIGFTAVAAPVFDRNGIIGSIGLAGATFKMMESLSELVRQTVSTAQHISKRLGHIAHYPS